MNTPNITAALLTQKKIAVTGPTPVDLRSLARFARSYMGTGYNLRSVHFEYDTAEIIALNRASGEVVGYWVDTAGRFGSLQTLGIFNGSEFAAL